MANHYIAASGSNTTPFDTWAKAATSTTTALADVIGVLAAGEDVYIDKAFALSNSSAQTYTFPGTAAAPNRVFSCTTITNNPPVSADLGAGAAITTTGASSININGYVYVYGVVFNVGTGTSAANFVTNNASNLVQTYDTCTINIKITTASCNVYMNLNGTGTTIFINTPIVFSGGAACTVQAAGSIFMRNIAGPAISNPNASLTAGITVQGSRTCLLIADGVDFSGTNGIANNKNIIGAAPSTSIPTVAQFINCKYTATALFGTPSAPQQYVDVIVTDTGATNYKQSRVMYQGTLTQSTSVYNNATDGTTPISWQVITTANANTQNPFECFQIVQWAAAGTYANSKVFITSATASLKTNDVWVDVEYLGSSYALGSPATSFGAGSGSATLPQIPGGTTPGTLAAASPAWAVGSLGNDYQLAIPSFTTSAAGFVRFVVKVGKASLTVNIDDKAVIA